MSSTTACSPAVRGLRSGSGRPSGAARVRLTPRGRALVVLVALVLLVVGFSVGQASLAAGPTRHAAPPTVTVQPGETLWRLAARVAPHVDPRLVVTQIEQLNHLSGPQLLAGQQLVVPRAR